VKMAAMLTKEGALAGAVAQACEVAPGDVPRISSTPPLRSAYSNTPGA